MKEVTSKKRVIDPSKQGSLAAEMICCGLFTGKKDGDFIRNIDFTIEQIVIYSAKNENSPAEMEISRKKARCHRMSPEKERDFTRNGEPIACVERKWGTSPAKHERRLGKKERMHGCSGYNLTCWDMICNMMR